MKYKIITGSFFTDLETEVNKYLVLGWKCQGGVCAVLGAGYYQAMIKEKVEFVGTNKINV